MGKIIACKTTELESGNMKKVIVDGREIVVANVDGNYFACDTHVHILVQVCRRELLMALLLHAVGMVPNLTAQMESFRNSQLKLMN